MGPLDAWPPRPTGPAEPARPGTARAGRAGGNGPPGQDRRYGNSRAVSTITARPASYPPSGPAPAAAAKRRRPSDQLTPLRGASGVWSVTGADFRGSWGGICPPPASRLCGDLTHPESAIGQSTTCRSCSRRVISTHLGEAHAPAQLIVGRRHRGFTCHSRTGGSAESLRAAWTGSAHAAHRC
jgi:hypothetical protein